MSTWSDMEGFAVRASMKDNIDGSTLVLAMLLPAPENLTFTFIRRNQYSWCRGQLFNVRKFATDDVGNRAQVVSAEMERMQKGQSRNGESRSESDGKRGNQVEIRCVSIANYFDG